MERFRVVLEGIDLDEAQADGMQEAIQKAVLAELARMDFGGDQGAAVFAAPSGKRPAQGAAAPGVLDWQWRGMITIFQGLKNFDKVNEVATRIHAGEFQQRGQ